MKRLRSRLGTARNAITLCALLALPAYAQSFAFPTANHALLTPGAEERFFVGTIGKSWTSGTFGCVRSGGGQMHEGLDIRSVARDKHGEPTDPILATADGTVAYFNSKPALSNFGKYIILRHRVDGIEIYSLYGHLAEIRPGVKIGQGVKMGETIGVMGRTANTHEGISKDRAHVHFELNLFVNDRFSNWHKQAAPGQRNDHGDWNGQNLLALDPRPILLDQAAANFNLLRFIQHQTELCRVVVRRTSFPWLKRYPALIRPNAVAEKEGVAGYELALNFNGIPFELIPRAASEIRGKTKFQLLSVNAGECRKNPARRLVVQKGKHWELGPHGINLLELLTY